LFVCGKRRALELGRIHVRGVIGCWRVLMVSVNNLIEELVENLVGAV